MSTTATISIERNGIWINAHIQYDADPKRMLPLLNKHFSTIVQSVALVEESDIAEIYENGEIDVYNDGKKVIESDKPLADPMADYHYKFESGRWTQVLTK